MAKLFCRGFDVTRQVRLERIRSLLRAYFLTHGGEVNLTPFSNELLGGNPHNKYFRDAAF